MRDVVKFYTLHRKTIMATLGWVGLAIYYASQGLTEQTIMALASAATTAGLGPAWTVSFAHGRAPNGPPFVTPAAVVVAQGGETK